MLKHPSHFIEKSLSTGTSPLSFHLKLFLSLAFLFISSFSLSFSISPFFSLSLSHSLASLFSHLSLLSCYAKHLMCSHMFRHLRDSNMKNFSEISQWQWKYIYTVCLYGFVCVCMRERLSEWDWCEFDFCPQPGKDIVSLRIKSYA